MNLNELKAAIAQLPRAEQSTLAAWFEEFLADAWDRQIEEDALAGRLDKLANRAREDFKAGRCRELAQPTDADRGTLS